MEKPIDKNRSTPKLLFYICVLVSEGNGNLRIHHNSKHAIRNKILLEERNKKSQYGFSKMNKN